LSIEKISIDKAIYSMQIMQHTIVSIFYVGKIALFDKALVSALARGALAMCAMWVGNCFKKCAVGKK
jgi:hypothetical protein